MKNLFRLFFVFILLLAISGCAGPTNAQRGHLALKYGRYNQAINYYTEAIKSDNLSSISLEDAYFNRGYAKMRTNDFDGAITDFNKAIEINPKNSRVYYSRGVAKENKNDFDGSIVDYNKAIELDPKFIWAYENRGIKKSLKNDFDGAIADFNRTIELDPKKATAYLNRGLAKLDKFDYDEAIIDFDKAIDLDSKCDDAFLGRGFAFLYKNKPDKAITDFEEALKIYPNHHYALWLFLARERNKQNGRTELKEYREKKVKGTDWAVPVMRLYLGEITPEDCLATLDNKDHLQDKRQKVRVYYFIGQFYILNGNHKKAAAYFQKSVEFGNTTPNDSEYRQARHELRKLNQKN